MPRIITANKKASGDTEAALFAIKSEHGKICAEVCKVPEGYKSFETVVGKISNMFKSELREKEPAFI